MNHIGKTVILDDVQVYKPSLNKDVVVSGDFTVEEFHPYEPSAYVWTDQYDLIPVGVEDERWEDEIVSIDAFDLDWILEPERMEDEQAREEKDAEEDEAQEARERVESFENRIIEEQKNR